MRWRNLILSYGWTKSVQFLLISSTHYYTRYSVQILLISSTHYTRYPVQILLISSTHYTRYPVFSYTSLSHRSLSLIHSSRRVGAAAGCGGWKLRFRPPVLWSTTKDTFVFFWENITNLFKFQLKKYELQAAECKNLQNKEYKIKKKLSKMFIVRMINLHISRKVVCKNNNSTATNVQNNNKKV